jgi:hypothetical protein
VATPPHTRPCSIPSDDELEIGISMLGFGVKDELHVFSLDPHVDDSLSLDVSFDKPQERASRMIDVC